MAELNFNALARPGPRSFVQGFGQGQEQQMTEDINRTNLESGRFKLDELKRDRAEMMQLQEKLKGMGQDPDLDKFMDAYISTGRPDYVKLGLEGKQKLKEQREFSRIVGGGDMAAPAPAAQSMMRMPQAPAAMFAPTNALGSGMFGMEAPAPANALANRAAPAAPVNAMTAGSDQTMIAQTQKRINDLMQFSASNPGMATQAMQQAKLLQDQLELYSKRAPATPAFVQEYEYAKKQGYQGSLFDFKRELASAGRAPVQPVAPTITQIVDPKNPDQMITIDARQYRGGTVGAPGVLGVGGKGNDKPLSESQGNATAYGMRMKEANNILEDLAKKGVLKGANIEKTPFVGGVLGQTLPGFLGGTNEAQQQVNQAKSNFITAVLRKESGAVISDSEFEREDKKYFPQINDNDAVIKQKANARKLAIRAMEIQAGPGAKQMGGAGGVTNANPNDPLGLGLGGQ